MITVKTDVVVTFGDNLKKAAEALGVTFSWLLQDQMRLLCQDMLKITAPSKKVIAAKTGTDWPNDRKIGQRAVFKDLNRIFWLAKNDEEELKGKKKKQFKQDMANWHSRWRSKGTGRTSGPSGGNAPDGRMVVRQRDFLRYYKQHAKNVGTLKASWVRPLKIYQQKVGGRASVPGWINKYANVYPATITETMAGQNLVSITVINSANMIRRKIDASALASAMRTRQKDLNGQVIKRKDRIVAQFNANQQPKPITTQAA